MRCGVRCKTRDFSFSGHLYVLHGTVGQGDAQDVQAGGDVGGVDRGLWGWQRRTAVCLYGYVPPEHVEHFHACDFRVAVRDHHIQDVIREVGVHGEYILHILKYQSSFSIQ